VSFLFKVILGALLLFLGVAGVSFLQSRFDNGDERKALQAIYFKFPEFAGQNQCNANMISRVRGIVEVDCGARAWVVDVLQGAIREGRENP